jgi:hypothetical protein
MRIIKQIARIIVGITFIFSGFVKGIDPWGSAYKFVDYFVAMGLDWFNWTAFPLGVLLAFVEFAIGVGLLFNIYLRLNSWLAFIFMGFFTALTLWIALYNPVTDCGCFGDALVISNWETFYKNVVLIILTWIVFANRNNMPRILPEYLSKISGAVTVLLYLIAALYSYNHLPIFDFRPYKTGVNIPEAMSIPEGAPQPQYENIFYYKNKNTGNIEKFTEDNYPWEDTLNWEFNNLESVLIDKGYEPSIHDFTIETPEGDNIIDFFIYDEEYVFMLIAYDLKKSNTKSQQKINKLAEWAMEQGYSFICLTSSLPDDSQKFAQEHQTPYEFFNCDEITLKTIIRSNPGLVVIKDGTILAKYHYNDIPAPLEFQENINN